MNPQLVKAYALIPQANGTDYKFQTKDGVYYNAVLGTADEFFPGTSFAQDVRMFAVRPDKGSIPAPGVDARIGATLAEITDRFFRQDPTGVFFYVCATEDKKELARLRKFDKMFELYDTDSAYIKTVFSDKEAGAHGAVICRKDHPAATQISKAARNIPGLFT